MSEFANSLPRSVWNTSMSVSGDPSVAKAALTSRASFLPPAACPTISRLCRSTNRILKAELVYRETFGTTRELQVKLADYMHWYNNFRIHSTLGYMTPVEFRKAGLVLPRSSKKM